MRQDCGVADSCTIFENMLQKSESDEYIKWPSTSNSPDIIQRGAGDDQPVPGVQPSHSLSIFFATLCVIDLFGVFPIIALPSAIISCGLYGIPLTLFVISLQIYTAVVLGRCWIIAEKLDPTITTKNRYPYAAIADLIYGKYMSLFVTILLDVTVFGGGIPNLLVASQNLELLGLRISNGNFHFSFCYWLIILGVLLCPIMWLGSPKNMKTLASLSVLTVSSVSILTWYCIQSDPKYDDISSNTTSMNSTELDVKTTSLTLTHFVEYLKETEYPNLTNLLKTYGIIAFQFDIHPMLLTIQVDMKNKRKIGKSVSLGILFTISMAAITTIVIVMKYGVHITPNILETLPKSWALYITILLVTLQLCLSSAVGSSALFQHVEDVFETSRNFTYKRCIIRSCLVGLAIIIGELLPRFDLVMGLVGGTLTGPLIFILPPLFYTKITHLEEIYDAELDKAHDDQRKIEKELYNNDETSYGSIPLIEQARKGILVDDSSTLCKICTMIINFLKFICSDCVISIFVVGFGLSATLISTYSNIFDLSLLVQWSPCLSNATFNFFKS